MSRDDITSSTAHFRQVSALAERLQVHGFVIYEHHWDLLDSGDWTLVAGWQHRRFEFGWAGRESAISVSECHTHEGLAAQHWSAPRIERLSSDDPAAPFLYTEQFFHPPPDT